MLERTVSRFLAHHKIDPTAHFVVGVSGGVDSLALLHALINVYPNTQITVAHLNHLLRKEAADDAQFVQKVATAYQINCVVGTADVPALAKQSGDSIETAARIARYAFLADVAAQCNTRYIIVAHHADDQAETVLMNLLRGAGLHGLGGMRPVAPVPHAPHLILLRPLLTHPKSDLIAYCEKHNITPRHDASNDDTTYFRNRVRHEIRPVLDTHAPHLRERLVQLADVVAAESDYITAQTEKTLADIVIMRGNGVVQLNKSAWRTLPLALQRRTLRSALHLLHDDLEISYATLEQARTIAQSGQLNAQSTLPNATTLTVNYDSISLATRSAILPIDAPQLLTSTSLTIPGTTHLANGWTLTAAWERSPTLHTITTNKDRWQTWLDIDSDFELKLNLAPRQSGERMKPFGMNGRTKSLKTIMIDQKIPAVQRDLWPIVRYGDEVVWIVGCVRGEWGRVTADSKRVLHLQCYRRPIY